MLRAAGACLPAGDGPWHELDSSVSSDALLMNIFCYPRITSRANFCNILGIETGSRPEFGFRPRVPLLSGAIERTEIDMKLGNVLFEAKLTEADFQLQRAELVEGYRDLREVFACRQLPRIGKKYASYQLIRNILAAYALELDFCALIDARRPDLIEDWYAIVCCVRSAELLAEKLWSASRKERRTPRTIVLKLKTSEFKILTRSYTPGAPPSSCAELTEIALQLRERVESDPQQRYRLVGVGLSNFQDLVDAAGQPTLFE